MTKTYDIIRLGGHLYAVDKEATLQVSDYAFLIGLCNVEDSLWRTEGCLQQVKHILNGRIETDHSHKYVEMFLPPKQFVKIVCSTDPSLGLPLIEEDYHQRLKQIFKVVNTKAGKEGNLTIDVLSFEDEKEAVQFCEGKGHLQIIADYTVVAAKTGQYSSMDVEELIIWMGNDANRSRLKGKLASDILKEFSDMYFPQQVLIEMEEGKHQVPIPAVNEKGFVKIKQFIYK